jgi:hypothetical protein
MKTIHLAAILLFTCIPLRPQATGFFDDFEDGDHGPWQADHPATFGITESGGYLNIAYNRTAESDVWDNFNFTPPEQIDVSVNPRIIMKIRSDVATTFTVKPIYTNTNSGWLPVALPGDNLWHTYTFELVESNYSGGLLEKIYLYLDGGSTELKSGLVQFDDFQIAGFTIAILNLKATLVDSSRIDLSWETDDPVNTDHFNIYRNTTPGYPTSEEYRIAETGGTVFQDTGLINNTTYYYQVTAVDTEGKEHSPATTSMRTSVPGTVPVPEIIAVNTDPVGKYEKFEILISMPDATYGNPFDPDEIDLHAWFYAPTGDSVKINGFYDNYQGCDQWLIRFSANRTGIWTYRVYATDVDGTGNSELQSFSVVESGLKGWLRISPENPDYLMYDDGTSFYGLAAYYPWNVMETRLDELRESGVNFFGYWDCTYDWAGNGGGAFLLESKDAGLGRYDQRKAARIDELLSWAEERDMKVMLAMWTHPYLRLDGIPWDNGQWLDYNPYSSIVEPEDFYSDSLALALQDKHHRYMIARWGYSRALGVWEIINEIHGTTGWVRDRQAALDWIERVHAYMKESDPFHRATTASFGGIETATIHASSDQLGDIPNVHFYEQQGWPKPYPGDVVRSGLADVVSECRKLKNLGDRPAFFGEAGYTSMFADAATPEYTWEFHDAFWAGLANGLASTPFWWEVNEQDIITPERMQTYGNLGRFAADIDFAHLPLEPAACYAEGTDAYVTGADSTGFGWMKSYGENTLPGTSVYISGTTLENGNYMLEWYNTWTGAYFDSDTVVSVDGHSWTNVSDGISEEDVAFKMFRLDAAATAGEVRLALVQSDTLIQGPNPWSAAKDSVIYTVVGYACDENGNIDVSYQGPVTLEILVDGETTPVTFTPDLRHGGYSFVYERSGSAGATITATVDGLGTDVLYIEGIVGTGADRVVQAGYSLGDAYPNPFNRSTRITFDLRDGSNVELAVYDARGRLVKMLADEFRPSGHHSLVWDAADAPAGVYYYVLRGSGFCLAKKCVLLR